MMITRLCLSVLLSLLVLVLPTLAAAAGYTGTYFTDDPAQRLTLTQSPDGSVAGDMQRGGTNFSVSLAPHDGQMIGAAQDPAGTSYPVLAQLHDGTLYFKVYQADAQGNVLSETGIQYEFSRGGRPEQRDFAQDWSGTYTDPFGGKLKLSGSGGHLPRHSGDRR